MPDVEQARWALEEAVTRVLSFVKGASYGLRLAEKRLGEMSGRSPLPGEMDLLVTSLESAPDDLSDLVILGLGDHFRTFLARALELPAPPNLPPTVAEVEALAGVPGALARAPFSVSLLLLLYRAALRDGRLDRLVLDAVGKKELEIVYPGGKVKLFRLGDRVALTEPLLNEMGTALLEAARAIELRIITA